MSARIKKIIQSITYSILAGLLFNSTYSTDAIVINISANINEINGSQKI